MKLLATVVLLSIAVSTAHARLKCNERSSDIPRDFLDMTRGCIKEVRRQIQAEIDASIQYLAMGAHFATESVNLNGFSEFFLKAASEEREHATKLIEYLLLRGQLTDDVSNLITVNSPEKHSWSSGSEALKHALKTEAKVTKSIRNVIEKCENDYNTNDYHLVDFLTGEFLQEQYSGQRDLAGKISTLDKLMATQGRFGEFLFDKQIMQ